MPQMDIYPDSPETPQKRKSRLETDGLKVGLKPQKGWAKRNYQYLRHSLVPAMAKKREPAHSLEAPEYIELEPGQIEVFWIGHASFLVRTPQMNILIDPVWAKWMGPLKRSREPGLKIEHLPKIDLILLSHAHFDHLHRPTLRRIADGTQTVLVPKDVKRVLKGLNFKEVHEMEHWEEFPINDDVITFTPASHWGARMIHDTHRGFGGFLIRTPESSLYHSGDTAYFDGFQEIGERYQIGTALLPIGAYDCPSGREVHMNPEEAIQAMLDLGAMRMLPMHHETFAISNEHLAEPMQRLKAEAEKLDLIDMVYSPKEGESVLISEHG